MALSDIISAVTATGSLPLGATVEIGEENLAKEGTPPRVVWVPTSDRFVAPTERGATTQRSLHTRQAGVDVHLWGADFAGAESLLAAFVYALRQVVGANYLVTSGQWFGQRLQAHGRIYVLSLVIGVPLAEPAPQRTVVVSEPQDVAFQH